MSRLSVRRNLSVVVDGHASITPRRGAFFSGGNSRSAGTRKRARSRCAMAIQRRYRSRSGLRPSHRLHIAVVTSGYPAIVTEIVNALDIRPCFRYSRRRISPAYRTAAGDTGRRGESGSRGRGLVTSVPGRLRGSTPGRHDDRSAGKLAGLGQEGAGNARWWRVIWLFGSGVAKRTVFRTIGIVRPTESHMWTAPCLQGSAQSTGRSDCDHMSGLLSRSHMTAAKMGSATRVPNRKATFLRVGHWDSRSVSRLGIDRSRHLLRLEQAPASTAGRQWACR